MCIRDRVGNVDQFMVSRISEEAVAAIGNGNQMCIRDRPNPRKKPRRCNTGEESPRCPAGRYSRNRGRHTKLSDCIFQEYPGSLWSNPVPQKYSSQYRRRWTPTEVRLHTRRHCRNSSSSKCAAQTQKDVYKRQAVSLPTRSVSPLSCCTASSRGCARWRMSRPSSIPA